MRILFVSQYFPPEMGAPAARTSELAREWARLGHEVTVLTAFAHHPTGRKAAADRWRLTRREELDGVRVIRSYIWASANRGTVKRMISYLSFMISTILIGGVRAPRADIVIATSPQLLCAGAGYVLARLKRVPFVFEVRDLWPESILAVEAMTDNVIVRGLRALARHLYRRSDAIVTVGDGYRSQIHERYDVPMERMSVIANGIDPELFQPQDRDNEIRREHGWGDRFVLLYLGTHGMAHALRSVLEVAMRFREDADKLFVFVGEGAEKRDLQRIARANQLDNVLFIDQQPKSRVRSYYAACDLGLVTLRDTPLFQNVLPSKIFEYLAMERPVIATVGGHARRVLEESGAGFHAPPENPAALAELVESLSQDRPHLASIGKRGRGYVLAHYDRRQQAASYLELLAAVVARAA